MAGSKAGGLKARETNLKRYGNDFYKIIGSKGGQSSHTGGFASNPALARLVGAKGGRMSRRTGVANGQGKTKEYVWKGDSSDELVFAQEA